jgi:hypothetical protein
MRVASIGGNFGGKPGEVGASHGAEAGKAEVLIVNGTLIVKVCWASGCTVHWITQSAAIADIRRGVCGVAFRNAKYPDLIVLVLRAIPPTATLEPATQLFLANHRQYWPQPRVVDVAPNRLEDPITP